MGKSFNFLRKLLAITLAISIFGMSSSIVSLACYDNDNGGSSNNEIQTINIKKEGDPLHFAFDAKVKFNKDRGDIKLWFGSKGADRDNYCIEINGPQWSTVELTKTVNNNTVQGLPIEAEYSYIPEGTWFDVRIIFDGGKIMVFINSELYITYIDPNPLPIKKVEFYSESREFSIKNISISKLPGDYTPPVITIGPYDGVNPTNQDITVTASTNEGTLNATSHTFTENGSFVFVARDAAGNVSRKVITITNIDKIPPRITILPYNAFFPTKNDIVVCARTNEGTLNETSHTFTRNGSFDFIATDDAGNVTVKTVTITNIDKDAPVITLGEYNTNPTNQNIVVTASVNEGWLNARSHLFTENGTFEFVAIDIVGNISRETVTITNIDKVKPIITIGEYDGVTLTNQDVVVTASSNEGTLNETSHTFTENGSFTFVATDPAGNTSSRTVTITNIDKVAPVITIVDYNTEITNQDIVVAATTNEGTLNESTHTFTENGSFDFIATDAAGNVTVSTVTITNIDKTACVITIGEYNTAPTNQDIVVTATTENGTLNATSHTFTENGSFDFIATDSAGNITVVTVTIVNIDKVAPVITIGEYDGVTLTNQDIVVTAETNEGTLNATSHTFTENGSFDFVATDAAGNVTMQTVTITNIDKVAPIITLGDYDGVTPTNQDITVTASTNEGTLNATSHTFTENGSFDFIVTDDAGNVTILTVTISNIDKNAPIITIGEFDGYTPTNQDIIVTATVDDGVLNEEIHTFTENGSFDFIATDAAGNVTIVTVTITNIDKTPPVITIGDYDGVTPTNQDIVVTAETNEGVINATSFTFTENGSFDFVAYDVAGNITTVTVTITNIDKTAPIITLGEYVTTPTNQDIIVSASTNEGSLNAESHTFTENGSFDFVATDAAGNVSIVTVSIANIDKIAPILTLGDYDGVTPTNQNITVTAQTNEGIVNAESYTFTENGSFDFVAMDAAGNITTQTVTITNIDKTAPIITLGEYDGVTPTNQDIIVTAQTNEGTLNTTSHLFTQNGSFNFVATDAAGNVTTLTVTITNINKVAPVITIGEYDGVTPTNQNITVTATTDNGTLNAASYTFTENGSFDFIATDAAGNISIVTVTITNIDKVAPVIEIGEYDGVTPTNQDITVTASTNEGTLNTTSHTFTENGSFNFVATDAAGNVTVQTVEITNIDKVAPIITIGEYDGVTPTYGSISVSATTNEGTLNYAGYIFFHNGSIDFVATDEAGNVTTVTVTITNIVEQLVDFGNYIVDGTVIKNFVEMLDVDTFMSNIEVAFGAVVRIIDQNGNDMTSADYSGEYEFIGTGATIEVYFADDVLCEVYEVLLRGDCNGDAYIDSGDIYTINRYMAGLQDLQGIYLIAANADADPDNYVDTGDTYTIRRYMLGLDIIDQTA